MDMVKGIIIAEDIKFFRKKYREIFSSIGWNVIAEASNGEELIEAYEKHNPDAIITDIIMPKMSGLDAIREILKRDQYARVVAISAVSGQERMVEKLRFDYPESEILYINKPLTEKVAVEEIKKWVDR